MKADDLAPLKESGDDARFQAVLKAAQWSTWVMRIMSKSRSGKHSFSLLQGVNDEDQMALFPV